MQAKVVDEDLLEDLSRDRQEVHLRRTDTNMIEYRGPQSSVTNLIGTAADDDVVGLPYTRSILLNHTYHPEV